MNRTKKNKNNNRSMVPRQPRGSMYPPPYNNTITVKHTWRYIVVVAQATPNTISFNELGNLLVFNNNSTVTSYQIFDAVRCLKVEVWAPSFGSTSITTGECSVEFSGTTAGAVGSSRRVADRSASMDRPAHVCLSPDPMSQAGQWQTTAGGSIICFGITCTAGATIAVTLLHRITDTTRVQSVTTTNPGTVGQLYYLALDGPASNNFVIDGPLPTLN